MDNIVYFFLWELALVIVVLYLYLKLCEKKFSLFPIIGLILFTCIAGYKLFYDTFEFNAKLYIKKSQIRIDGQTKEKYNLLIDEKEWVVDDWKDEGIQIGEGIYSFGENESYILLNASKNEEYDGKRNLLVDGSKFLVEEVHTYNNVEFNIKQYTYYDGIAEIYGDEYYKPYYIFEFDTNGIYYSVRIINNDNAREAMYVYGTENIRKEDLQMYLNYIDSIIDL